MTIPAVLADDASEMRLLAEEWLHSPGPIADLARYLVAALDDRAACLDLMARGVDLRCQAAARARGVNRVDLNLSRKPGYAPSQVRRIVAKARALRPEPRPISEQEIDMAMRTA